MKISGDLIEFLRTKNYLREIDVELDINLEIPHIAYLEIKKAEPKVLLFNKPVDRLAGKNFDIPVLMNLFSSYKITEDFFGRTVESVANEIEKFIKLKPPTSFIGKLEFLKDIFKLKNVLPNRQSKNISDTHVRFDGHLTDLPILKTWSGDGGKFITMGQTYAHSPDGSVSNVGMYRLQVFDGKTLGMHWQIHKDTNIFFQEYKKLGIKMPVSIGIGGDPLYTWVATAPLPHGINEMLLYGFIKNYNAKLINSNSNYVPADLDIVIEGFVDPLKSRIEGPFGDHTGYYTLPEEYPILEVTNIYIKKNKPIYYATVVGKPPLEDKYMGWATERVFLPLLRTTAPDLIDYAMPENGVFHNLILGKMRVRYLGHPQQFMHTFWGVGQMSFVKNAIFVGENSPDLKDYPAITRHILNRLTYKNIMISIGTLDALDHSSPNALLGGKLGIDATSFDEVKLNKLEILTDDILLTKAINIFNSKDVQIFDLKQYFKDTQNPITIITVDKNRNSLQTKLKYFAILKAFSRIIIIVDNFGNNVNNIYMILWRVANNFDAQRDLYIEQNFYVVDGTNKLRDIDDLNREWPDDVTCDKEILLKLHKNGIIDYDMATIEKFQII